METITYEAWLDDVDAVLKSINMSKEDWQGAWPFDFRKAFAGGVSSNDAANMANRYWWQLQNRSLQQECRKSAACWLPQNHQGDCEPV